MACIKAYVEGGGSALFLFPEGGAERLGTNLDKLLTEYGVTVNKDAVLRTVYYKYLHPKEVFVSNGVLSKELVAAALNKKTTADKKDLGGRALEAAKKYGNNKKEKS